MRYITVVTFCIGLTFSVLVEANGGDGGDVWVVAPVASYHSEREWCDGGVCTDYNEFNPGIGMRGHVYGVEIEGGTYKNSYANRSNFISAVFDVSNDWIGAGVNVGVVSGYPALVNVKGVTPMVLPFVRVFSEQLELKMGTLPAQVGYVLTFSVGYKMR